MGGWIAFGKKVGKAKVSLASPFNLMPPVLVPSSGWYLKKRKYIQVVLRPYHASNNAVSVPNTMPEKVFKRRNIAGKCLTRILTRPLYRLTVCSGTSCLKATRNAACNVIAPAIGVSARDVFRVMAPQRT